MFKYATLHAKTVNGAHRTLDTFVSADDAIRVAEKRFQKAPQNWKWFYVEQNGVVIKDWLDNGTLDTEEVHWCQKASMNYLKHLLDKQGVSYRTCGSTSFILDDVDGCISVVGSRVRFLHCNAEPSIGLNDICLSAWIKAYAEGNDEFAGMIRSAG